MQKMDIDELRENQPEAYAQFVQHLINECEDKFTVLEDGRILNADRPDGSPIIWDPQDADWAECFDTDDFEDGE